MRFIASWLALIVLVFGMAGCTRQQVQDVTTQIKMNVDLATQVEKAANQIVQAAAPGSKAAVKSAKITRTVARVNGVVQSVTIVIPMEAPTTVAGKP